MAVTAKALVERDHRVISSSYTRDYPLVAKTGRGAMVEDVDGNTFLDFAAGIAGVDSVVVYPTEGTVTREIPVRRARVARLLRAGSRPAGESAGLRNDAA